MQRPYVCLLALRPSPYYFCCNDTPPTEIYTLSLHDALPICPTGSRPGCRDRTDVLALGGRLDQLVPQEVVRLYPGQPHACLPLRALRRPPQRLSGAACPLRRPPGPPPP